ncbi:LppU/SCO3897 family protein [Micromonospora andamanensis]|uniref:LppU/SCO3897 family protein n=1 Tax=Micromonospora andamanensis TaxID=1287068 RepID=UPI00402B3DF7
MLLGRSVPGGGVEVAVVCRSSGDGAAPATGPGRTRAIRRLLLAALAGGLITAAAAVAVGCASADDQVRVGDCLEATGEGAKTSSFRQVDCSAPQAAYRVAIVADSLEGCASSYGSFDLPYSRSSNHMYCLMLNAVAGDCFRQQIDFPTGRATKVHCDDSATYRITAVSEGVANRAVCGDEARANSANALDRPRALVYPQPPTTLCVDPL